MRIVIETIPHSKQEYNTVGNWKFMKNGDLHVSVSFMDNEEYEALVGLHEVTEALLCRKRGIEEKDVTSFDETFEDARKEYPNLFGDTEPGNHPQAPYNKEHLFASRMEHSVAMELGVSWEEYNKTVNEL